MTNLTTLLLPFILILSGCTNIESTSKRSVYTAKVEFDSSRRTLSCTVSIKWENSAGRKVQDIPLLFRFPDRVNNIHSVMLNGKTAEYTVVSTENTASAGNATPPENAASTENTASAGNATPPASSDKAAPTSTNAPTATKASSDNAATIADAESDSFNGIIIHQGKGIAPGSAVTIALTYTMAMEESFRDQIFVFSEIFPVIPPVKQGEFMYNFQIHSDYQVDISIREEQMVASTGLSTDESVISGIRNIETFAEAVPSYGIVVMEPGVQLSETNRDGSLIRSFYFKDDTKWGEKLTMLASDIIGFYTDTLGFYPQPVLNIIPGYESPQGGWPVSPNIVGVHRGIDLKKDPESHAAWIMSHEIAHQYWGFNYILEPLDYPQWYGISMGIYTDLQYTSARRVDKDYNRFFFGPYTDGVEKGYNTVIMQQTDSLDLLGFDWNNVILHGKSWAALRMLEQEIGEEKMQNLFFYSLKNYKGVNVTLQMFMADCEMIAGRDMDQFFKTWYLQNEHLEYRITEISTPPGDTGGFSRITVSRSGEAATDNVDLAFVLSDNDTLVTVIDGREESVTLTARFSSPLMEVIPDPYFKLPLVNRQSRKVSEAY